MQLIGKTHVMSVWVELSILYKIFSFELYDIYNLLAETDSG